MKTRQVGTAIIFAVAALLPVAPIESQTPSAGLRISPSSVDFGEARVSSESSPRAVTFTNPTANIMVEQIITSGIDFSEKHDCGETLAPAAQCTVQVFFRPATLGPRLGTLVIMGSDPTSPHFVALMGIGT